MLWHTQCDCKKNRRIASLASKQMTEYCNTWYKPSRTAKSLKEAFRRIGTSINSLRKQAKEKISMSKSKTWKKISSYRKSGIIQRILQRDSKFSPTSQKTRPQERRERERQKLWLLWKDRADPAGRNFPAYGQQCLKCGKYNPFASCCRICAQIQEGCKETKREWIKKIT